MRLRSAATDKMCLHVFCLITDSLSGEGESFSVFRGRDGESKALAPQYFHKPSFRSALLMSDLPGISFATKVETTANI